MLTTTHMLKQYSLHTKTLANGDKLIQMLGGVYDIFSGQGWQTPIRFRIVRFKDKTKAPQLIQISGETSLSREYRLQLVQECSNG